MPRGDPQGDATAVAPDTNRDVVSLRIGATRAEYERMLNWASQWSQRRWAVENAEGMGRYVASGLLAHDEQLVDVPPRSTARVRQLSAGPTEKAIASTPASPPSRQCLPAAPRRIHGLRA